MALTPLKLAVFGHPVTHSLSPRIHARFAEALGMAVEYRAIDCPAGRLGERLEEFRAAGGRGCNLTVPLKTEGLALAARASRAARDAGACNTLVAVDDGWHADNTDGAGLIADFDRLGIAITDRRVLVLGAGGAVAGILGPLLDRGPDHVCIINRSLDRAERLVSQFADRGPRLTAAGPDGVVEGENFDLVIHATSLGHQGECPFIAPGWLAPGAIGYDLNYGPAHRSFAVRLAELEIRCCSGLGMLIEQAAAAFERFTGTRPGTAELHSKMNDPSTV